MRPSFVFCLAAVLCGAASAANLPDRTGWRAETFRFPLAFASSVPFEGQESVRFAPSFARFAAADGFTHALLWDIKPVPMEGAQLGRALAVYFDGLMENAARGRKLDELPIPAAVSLHPMRAPERWSDAYAGTLYTWNAFSRGEALRLQAEVTTRHCTPGHLQVFMAISMAPRRDKAWDALRELRDGTRCDEPPVAPAQPQAPAR
ncbi:MAG TPA: hypothetical protein VFE23_21265 [Usitatibacter sp.]|nr:hypothetical protein [Usitatibacter sp.]